jgi:RHS repeat-associated protein
MVTIGYDNANRRTSLTLPNGVVVAYGYEAASHVTSIVYTQGSTLIGDLTYTYDANGRRTSMGGSLAKVNLPSAITSATYNANNQLTNWNGTTLSYDLNGNMTYDGATTYTWDARNRLAAFGSTAFAYDSFGRRTSNATGTTFLYDGSSAVQELSGLTVTANLLAGGVDEIFTRTDSAGTRNFLADALGSTLALTDSTGTVQTQYTYQPFGQTTPNGASSTSTFQYTGRENDGTGLYYYRARYYNPTLGRFVSEDPLRFGGGDINLYAYVRNAPMSFSDPGGEERKDPDTPGNPGRPPAPYLPFEPTAPPLVPSEPPFPPRGVAAPPPGVPPPPRGVPPPRPPLKPDPWGCTFAPHDFNQAFYGSPSPSDPGVGNYNEAPWQNTQRGDKQLTPAGGYAKGGGWAAGAQTGSNWFADCVR